MEWSGVKAGPFIFRSEIRISSYLSREFPSKAGSFVLNFWHFDFCKRIGRKEERRRKRRSLSEDAKEVAVQGGKIWTDQGQSLTHECMSEVHQNRIWGLNVEAYTRKHRRDLTQHEGGTRRVDAQSKSAFNWTVSLVWNSSASLDVSWSWASLSRLALKPL